MKNNSDLSPESIDRIIEMAWEDRTPFDAIEAQFGLPEKEVIALMRREISPQSWRRWRKRVQGRATKHRQKQQFEIEEARFRCSRQRGISNNKISKR
ncbi:TIGR03643 family protein [Hugenholtzia roseola]|uniref:TIGR03643 family protein n=1 Tax=Hugenholtzia roseola TaxID=1002 RepID=UPI00047D0B68|nr:TIGR03643 family protein [Hugenholtzia roseola]